MNKNNGIAGTLGGVEEADASVGVIKPPCFVPDFGSVLDIMTEVAPLYYENLVKWTKDT